MDSFSLEETRPRTSCGVRHRVVLMLFLMLALFYSLRFNLSIGIVAMVDDGLSSSSKSTNATHARICPGLAELNQMKSDNLSGPLTPNGNIPLNESELNNQPTTFSWNEKDQGLILGSFFWGYVISQFPGGLLALRYGGKWVVGLGMVSTGVLSLVIPQAAIVGDKYFVILIRILQGFSEGFVIPAFFILLAKWTRPHERARMASACFAGMPFGTAITMIISGHLITAFGWPSVFYVPGILTIVWFIVWTLVIHESPEEHPSITSEELICIQGSATRTSDKTETTSHHVNMCDVPRKEIIVSGPVWAVFISQFASAWGHNMLKAEGPKYMHSALHFDIRANSYLSAAPYLLQSAFCMAVGRISDLLIAKKYLSMLTARKVCNSIGQWGSALCFTGIIISECYRPTAVVSYILSGMISGAMMSGAFVNVIDITPMYSGAIEGVINSAANIAGFGAPYVAGLILFNFPTISGWRYVFLVPVIANVIGNMAFIFGAKGKVQAWDPKAEINGDGGAGSPPYNH